MSFLAVDQTSVSFFFQSSCEKYSPHNFPHLKSYDVGTIYMFHFVLHVLLLNNKWLTFSHWFFCLTSCSYGGTFPWRAKLHKGWNCSRSADWWSKTISLPAHFCGNWCHSSGIGSLISEVFFFAHLRDFILTSPFFFWNWIGKWLSKSEAWGNRCYCKCEGILLSRLKCSLCAFSWDLVWSWPLGNAPFCNCFEFCDRTWIRCTLLFHLQAELGKPSPSHPDKGKVSIYVDCSPTAEPTFEVSKVSCFIACIYILCMCW